MGEKIVEAVKFLYGCITVETEANSLYNTTVEKLPCPELSTISISLAEDSQKHVKMIKELCRPLHEICFDPDELPKDFSKLTKEIHKLKECIAPQQTIKKEEIADFIKSLVNLEDCLHNLYANFLESTLFGIFAQVLSETESATEDNLAYIIGTIRDDNLKHRNMLIESLYYHRKATQKITKLSIKYQNPDAWIKC